MLEDDLDFYNFAIDAESVSAIAKWLAVIRLHCYTRTPACIYSDLNFKFKHNTLRNVGCVPVPGIISNIISEHIQLNHVRAAEFANADPVVRDLLIEAGILQAGAWCYGDKTYANGSRWRVSMATLVRLSPLLVRAAATVTRCDVHGLSVELARCVAALALGQAECAPLFWDEVEWVSAQGFKWTGSIVDTRLGC